MSGIAPRLPQTGQYERRRKVMLFAKVCLALLLIWYLLVSGRIGLSTSERIFATDNIPLICISAMSFIGSQILATFRILLLLSEIGQRISFFEAFKLTMIGNFFNMLFLGAVGGDVVKGYYLVNWEENNRGRSVGIVVMDRVIGMLALIVMGCLAGIYLGLQYRHQVSTYVMQLHPANAVKYGVFFIAAMALLGTSRRVRGRFREIFASLSQKIRFMNMIEGVGLIVKKKKVLISAFVMSMLIMWLSLAGLVALSYMTVDHHISDLLFSAVSSVVLMLGILPLTPGNIGWTEFIASFALATVGTKSGAQIFVYWRIVTTICSLPGGWFYLFISKRPCPTRASGE